MGADLTIDASVLEHSERYSGCAESVENKFKQRIHSLLNPREARSLLETLTGLKNTINGWGQCYCKFDVG